MQKSILFFAAVCVVTFLVPGGPTRAQAVEAAPKIVCDQPKFDFGEKDNSLTVECSFELRNEGDTTLEIIRARPSCGCTVADISDNMVPPGGKATIAAKLNLTGRRGKQHKTITVESNDPAQPRLVLVMEGTATSMVELNPMRVYVRELQYGSAHTDEVELLSRSEHPMKVLEVRSSNPQVEASFVPVEEGRRFKIVLNAADTLPRGLTSGRVSIRTDSKTAPDLSLPFHYQVVGELVVAPEQITFREAKDRTFTRNVIVKPGMVKDFKVERVEPPIPGIKVNVRALGAYGYQVQLLDIPASLALNGKEILIVTSVEPMREIRIPFRVIPSR
jgi:hypothetical protein